MTDERFRLAARLFIRARGLDPGERDTYLRKECHGDCGLLAEVESLLLADAHAAAGMQLTREGARARAALTEALNPISAWKHPKRIGQYEIRGVIALGGMGVVYRAEQKSPRRAVALKVIRPGFVSHAAIKRFQHEVSVLGRLQHPGIAQIYEGGTTETALGEQPFLAMELVEGHTLLSYAEEQCLTVPEKLRLFTLVVDAVRHAHERGIIHRDLKPANIIVDAAGSPKILDFGVAKSTGANVQVTSIHTGPGELIGTLAYMSPEQASGKSEAADTRSDVYSLGVILYEFLSGRLPHVLRDKTWLEAARIIQEENTTPLRSVHRIFRGDLDTIVATALEKEKERRYQSAESFGNDIRRFLNNEPIIARPPSKLYLLRKFTRRNRALVGGVVSTVLALIAGLGSTSSLLDSRGEVVSSHARALAAVWIDWHPVPPGKRLVVTDIWSTRPTTVHTVGSKGNGYTFLVLDPSNGLKASLQSGIIFGPDEMVRLHSSEDAEVTLSGYYVEP
ncbi:MAG: protein kinase [Planctomycetota bacterium]